MTVDHQDQSTSSNSSRHRHFDHDYQLANDIMLTRVQQSYCGDAASTTNVDDDSKLDFNQPTIDWMKRCVDIALLPSDTTIEPPKRRRAILFSTSSQPSFIRKVYGDGNCLFRAFSVFVTGHQDYYKAMRRAICQEIADNANNFWSEYIGDLNEYLGDGKSVGMRRSGTWGTDNEIRAFAQLFDCIVHVYSKQFKQWAPYCPVYPKAEPIGSSIGQLLPTVLLIANGEHFNVCTYPRLVPTNASVR